MYVLNWHMCPLVQVSRQAHTRGELFTTLQALTLGRLMLHNYKQSVRTSFTLTSDNTGDHQGGIIMPAKVPERLAALRMAT